MLGLYCLFYELGENSKEIPTKQIPCRTPVDSSPVIGQSLLGFCIHS